MPTDNDDQAAALAKALAPLIARELANNPDLLKDSLGPAIESQIGGLKKKNEQLLNEVRSAKKERRTHDRNGIPFDVAYTQEDEDRAIAWEKEHAAPQAVPPGTRAPTARNTVDGHIYISRLDARDPREYQKAKALAEAQGKALVVGSAEEYTDHATRNIGQPATPQRKRIVTGLIDDPITRTRYIREDLNGGAGLVQRRLDAERAGLKVATFASLDDLPEHLHHEVRTAE